MAHKPPATGGGSDIASNSDEPVTNMQLTDKNYQTANNCSSVVNTKTKKPRKSLDPNQGLARLGSRAALSFAFAFLRRAWRSGEDTDLCNDLLQESLEVTICVNFGDLTLKKCSAVSTYKGIPNELF